MIIRPRNPKKHFLFGVAGPTVCREPFVPSW
jgi:hypothetical protein